MFRERSGSIKMFVGGFLLLAALIFTYSGRDMLSENPFETWRGFAEPFATASGAEGSLVVIDQGRTRVSLLKEQKIAATIWGGKTGGGFFYAVHAAYNGANIYVADVKYAAGGIRVEAERILIFSENGRLVKTIFERSYTDNMPLQYGNIMDMRIQNGALYFLINNNGSLELYSVVDDTPFFIRAVSAGAAPYIFTAAYDALDDKTYAVCKSGLVYEENENGALAPINAAPAADAAPWGISASNGNVLVSELLSGVIMRPDGTALLSTEYPVYTLSLADDGTVSFPNGGAVSQLGAGWRILFHGSGVAYQTSYFVLRLFIWLIAAALAALLLFTLVRLARQAAKHQRNKRTRIFILIIVTAVFASSLMTAKVLYTSAARIEGKNRQIFTLAALTASVYSGGSLGDDVQELNRPRDYGGPAWQRIRAMLDPVCEAAYEQDYSIYYVIYKYMDDNLYGILEYEDTIGVAHPMFDFDEPELRAVATGELSALYRSDSDESGAWTYAIAPIYNSQGDIAGLIEMGANTDMEKQQTSTQMREIIFAAALLLLLLLAFFAAASLSPGQNAAPLRQAEEDNAMAG